MQVKLIYIDYLPAWRCFKKPLSILLLQYYFLGFTVYFKLHCWFGYISWLSFLYIKINLINYFINYLNLINYSFVNFIHTSIVRKLQKYEEGKNGKMDKKLNFLEIYLAMWQVHINKWKKANRTPLNFFYNEIYHCY